MKKILSTFLFLLFTISLHAQLGISKKKISEAQLIKELPLLVVLHDYEHPFYEKMNINLKEAIQKYWTYSESVEFITKDELKEFSKDKSKKDKYAYLMFSDKLYQANVHAGFFCIGLLNKKIYTHFKKFGNPNKELTLADYKQGLYWLQKDLTMVRHSLKEAKANTKILIEKCKEEIPNSTLLIDKDLITNNLKENISEFYKYNYKIVSKEVIDEAIINETPNVIYFKTLETVTRPTGSASDSREYNKIIETNTTSEHYKSRTVFSIFTVNIYKADNQEFLMSIPAMPKGKLKLKHFEKLIKTID